MDINPQDVSTAVFYQHLIRTILPRPIAWVSTISESGIYNLAPYSFFSGVGASPPSLVFCPSNRRDGSYKDTLANLLALQQFVISVVPYSMVEAMNMTSAEVASDESEYLLADVDAEPSRHVRPPRVRKSPVAFECELLQHLPLATGPGAANLVVGRIVHLHISDEVLDAKGFADPARLDLAGRLGGSDYCRTNDRFELARPTLPN